MPSTSSLVAVGTDESLLWTGRCRNPTRSIQLVRKFSLLTMSPGSDEGASVQKKSKRKESKGKAKELPSIENASTLTPRVDATTSTEECLPPWSWALLADSQPAHCPPVFTKDAKWVHSFGDRACPLIFHDREDISLLLPRPL